MAVVLTAAGVAALWVMAATGGPGRAWWELLAIAAICSAPMVLGLILLARRPRLAVGVCLVAFGVAPLLVFAVGSWGETAAVGHAWPGAHVAAVITAGSWVWFYLPPAMLAAVFPDGHVPSRRWRWLLFGWPIVLVAFHLAVAFDRGTYEGGGGKVHGAAPGWVPHGVDVVVGLASLGGLMALMVGSLAAIVVRYRRGGVTVRRQIRWLALSAFLLPAVLSLAWLSILLTGTVGAVVAAGLLVVFLAMPLGTVAGVLRHDLYDIDRLLSRTVSYTVVTVVLTGMFAVIVLVGGLVLGRGSVLPVALGTLACAAAFGRVRRRMQAIVDRRDRDRHRAVADMTRFVDAVRAGSRMPEQIDGALRAALADPALRVAYALAAADGSVTWLDGIGSRVPQPAEPSHKLAPGGRVVAAIGYGPATAARPGLFRGLLREAHLPLEAARARIEVQMALAETEASRARLLRAGYDERRRLERDLHDGAQQRLVAVGISLRLAQRHLPAGPTFAALDGAVAELQASVAELRRIWQGLRPSGLDDGLPAALRTLVRASPIPIELKVTADPVHDTIATTAYYVAAEAAANALKHAQPQQVRIEVSHLDGVLCVSVADDGRGGARITSGSGLGGLADRVSAGGGTLRVRSEAGHGTTVEAMLPCAS